jgi:putative membrane protein
MQGFIDFLAYFGTSIVLLAVFVALYEMSTPYREFREIKDGNTAAAVALSGAILGFIFPLLAAIFYTHSVLEMIKWAAITGAVQMIVFQVLHRTNGCGNCIQQRKVAPAILLAVLSIAVGMLNAISISY